MTGPSDSRLDEPVYQPAEDSVLLAEAALDALEPGWIVIETGTGSGFVADRLRHEAGVTVVGTDINPHACRRAADRGLDVVRMSLVDSVADGSVDAVVFNPPYLPADDRLPDDWLDRAVTGGPTGIELVSAWIGDLQRVLRDGGVAVCIVSTQTDLEAITTTAVDAGFTVHELADRTFPFERLVALGLRRST